jgi:hypothetical protein
MIHFNNEPRFSRHEASQKFNVRKKEIIPLMEKWVETYHFFVGKEIIGTFFHTGVSSLVCLLENGQEKYVLKVGLSVLDSRQEGRFLKVWKSAGVKVPNVLDEGPLGNYHFVLMEYIDVPILEKKYSKDELFDKKIYTQIGEVLRKMHEPKNSGFSNIVNDKAEPEYKDIQSWIAGDIRMHDQINYVKTSGILNSDEHGSVDDALAIIADRLKDNNESVYCHNDYNVANIFATEPLTVFDPWPCFHHPFMDLSRAIAVSLIGTRGTDEQIIEGYFSGEVFDRQLLQAFIVLNIVVKLKYQVETGNINGLNNFKEYLATTKDFLYV